MPRLLPLALAAAVAAGGAFAWHQVGRSAQADTPSAAPPPMPVPVAPVLLREMAETAEFTGFLHAVRSVELRPRVGGMIDSVEVPEGGLVQPGQVLFRIDQRPYRATLARAEAALAEARERHALAGRQHARMGSIAGGADAMMFGPHSERLLRAALATGIDARLSRDAGSYLCNYLSWRAIEAVNGSNDLRLAQFIHVPPLAHDGTAATGRSSITLEQLVDAGEAMLLELVKLTRQAARVSDADRTARAYQAAL